MAGTGEHTVVHGAHCNLQGVTLGGLVLHHHHQCGVGVGTVHINLVVGTQLQVVLNSVDLLAGHVVAEGVQTHGVFNPGGQAGADGQLAVALSPCVSPFGCGHVAIQNLVTKLGEVCAVLDVGIELVLLAHGLVDTDTVQIQLGIQHSLVAVVIVGVVGNTGDNRDVVTQIQILNADQRHCVNFLGAAVCVVIVAGNNSCECNGRSVGFDDAVLVVLDVALGVKGHGAGLVDIDEEDAGIHSVGTGHDFEAGTGELEVSDGAQVGHRQDVQGVTGVILQGLVVNRIVAVLGVLVRSLHQTVAAADDLEAILLSTVVLDCGEIILVVDHSCGNHGDVLVHLDLVTHVHILGGQCGRREVLIMNGEGNLNGVGFIHDGSGLEEQLIVLEDEVTVGSRNLAVLVHGGNEVDAVAVGLLHGGIDQNLVGGIGSPAVAAVQGGVFPDLQVVQRAFHSPLAIVVADMAETEIIIREEILAIVDVGACQIIFVHGTNLFPIHIEIHHIVVISHARHAIFKAVGMLLGGIETGNHFFEGNTVVVVTGRIVATHGNHAVIRSEVKILMSAIFRRTLRTENHNLLGSGHIVGVSIQTGILELNGPFLVVGQNHILVHLVIPTITCRAGIDSVQSTVRIEDDIAVAGAGGTVLGQRVGGITVVGSRNRGQSTVLILPAVVIELQALLPDTNILKAAEGNSLIGAGANIFKFKISAVDPRGILVAGGITITMVIIQRTAVDTIHIQINHVGAIGINHIHQAVGMESTVRSRDRDRGRVVAVLTLSALAQSHKITGLEEDVVVILSVCDVHFGQQQTAVTVGGRPFHHPGHIVLQVDGMLQLTGKFRAGIQRCNVVVLGGIAVHLFQLQRIHFQILGSAALSGDADNGIECIHAGDIDVVAVIQAVGTGQIGKQAVVQHDGGIVDLHDINRHGTNKGLLLAALIFDADIEEFQARGFVLDFQIYVTAGMIGDIIIFLILTCRVTQGDDHVSQVRNALIIVGGGAHNIRMELLCVDHNLLPYPLEVGRLTKLKDAVAVLTVELISAVVSIRGDGVGKGTGNLLHLILLVVDTADGHGAKGPQAVTGVQASVACAGLSSVIRLKVFQEGF